jgi:hypothetical protein
MDYITAKEVAEKWGISQAGFNSYVSKDEWRGRFG